MKYLFEDWKSGKPLPKSWDGADAVQDGWSRDQIDAFMKATAKPYTPPAVIEPEPEQEPVEYDDETPTGCGVALSSHPERDNIVDLKDWVFMTRDAVFYNRDTGEMMGKNAFDLAMSRITPFVEVIAKPGDDPKLKKLPPSVTLLDHLGGEIVSNDMYRPDVRGSFFFFEGVRYVNSFLDRTMPETDDNWQQHDGWIVCQSHIENILPGASKTLIQWMAHNVQFPGIKIKWSPIIVGVQGDGKTTISAMLQAAMGVMNVKPASTDELFSAFHDYAEGACVRVLEEIRVDGERRTAAMDKLKPFITNTVVSIIPKGRKGKVIQNMTNYLALTNHIDALAIDADDRRWNVFKTRFETSEAMKREIKQEYWTRIYDVIENHPGVIRGWLMNVDLDGFSPNVAPELSDAKRMMIEASRSPINTDVREAIELGGEGIHPDVIATDCLNKAVKDMGGRALSTRTIASILSECGWSKIDGVMRWNGKTRRVYYRREAMLEGMDGAGLISYLKLKLDETIAVGRDPLPDGLDQW